jgi:hypothetical protein
VACQSILIKNLIKIDFSRLQRGTNALSAHRANKRQDRSETRLELILAMGVDTSPNGLRLKSSWLPVKNEVTQQTLIQLRHHIPADFQK